MELRKGTSIILVLSTFFVLMGCSDNAKDVQAYVKNKYGFDVNVLSEPVIDEGNMGDSSYLVQRTDLPDFKFHVDTNGVFINKIDGDDYDIKLGYYELNESFLKSSHLSDLNQAGFDAFLKEGYGFDKSIKPVTIVVSKEEGAGITKSELSELFNTLSIIRFLNTELIADGYNIDNLKVDVLDSEDNKFKTINIRNPLQIGYLPTFIARVESDMMGPIEYDSLGRRVRKLRD